MMGMFDVINCEYPLPETDVPPPDGCEFQTKDTPDQYLTTYTITADGRLTWCPYEMEVVPKEERPYPNDDGFIGAFGMLRRVEQEPETLDWHGDIYFYTPGSRHVKGWWEYRARFTDGRLARIEVVDFTAPKATR